MQQVIVAVLVGIGVLVGGCGMEGARWWAKAQGIAIDDTNHACSASQLHDGRCQPLTKQGGPQ